MGKRETFWFIIVGIAAFFFSMIAFHIVSKLNGTHYQLSVARWLVLIPVLYFGYSRIVLIDILKADQVNIGFRSAEAIMMGRVALSIGASLIIKFFLEPITTLWLMKYHSSNLEYLSPIIADFGYGPIANYLFLFISSNYKSKNDNS